MDIMNIYVFHGHVNGIPRPPWLRSCLYDGVLTHYDSLSTSMMENQSMEMDNYQVGIPSPYMNVPTKWALAFGRSLFL